MGTGIEVPEDVRAAVLVAPGRMELRTFPAPEIGPGAGLLRLDAAGVCGTDPKTYHGTTGGVSYPLILGHEIVGTVARIGPEAAETWGVKEGDRVMVESCITCGSCPDCLQGEYRTCRKMNGYGLRTGCGEPPYLFGAFSEYMYLAPGSVVHPLPDSLPAEVAVFGPSALANGIEWTGEGGVRMGDAVVVLGVGQQGLFSCLAAKERGARLVIAVGLASDEARLQAARWFGADASVDVEAQSLVEEVERLTGGEMADVVMEVSGSAAARRQAVDLVRRRGTIVQCGLGGWEAEVPMPIDQMVHKQVRTVGALSRGWRSVRESLRILESGRYDFVSLVTHRFGLQEAERAVLVAGGEVEGENSVKVIVYPNGLPGLA